MRGLRNWLSLGVLAALVAVCGTALRDAASRPVRPVDQFNHQQLLDWLSKFDVTNEFSHTKLRLARRLAEDLRQGYDWQQDLAGLDDRQRDRFAGNFRELAGIWLLDRADRYASLSDPDRTAFIDEQLDDLIYWPVWQQQRTRELVGLLPRNPALAVQQIDLWTDGVEAAQRQRIQQFTGALYMRWQQRGFQFLPGGV
jgi:hypothetical protein